MADDPKSIGDILDRIEAIAKKDDKVELGHVVGAMGHRSHGPFLLIPALIEMSPIGGIPGLPSVLAAIIILVAVQVLLGRKHLWLPGFLKRRSIKAEKACKATAKMRGFARFMDRWFHGRLPHFTSGWYVKAAAIVCILLACAVPPLELLPFASTAPMFAIASFGLAMLVRDGLLMIVAFVLSVAAVAIGLGLAVTGKGGK